MPSIITVDSAGDDAGDGAVFAVPLTVPSGVYSPPVYPTTPVVSRIYDPGDAFGDPGRLPSLPAGSPAALSYSVTPFLPPELNGTAIYWTVQACLIPISVLPTDPLRDASEIHGSIEGPKSFFLDLNSCDTLLPVTYSALQQKQGVLRDSFEVTGISPNQGELFQEFVVSANATIPPIKIAFSVSLALYQEGLFSVWRTNLLTYSPPLQVNGTWSLKTGRQMSERWQPIDECMVFTSTDALLSNSRYTIKIEDSLVSANGQTLQEPPSWSFISYYRPFHVDPYRVQQRLGEYSKNVTKEDLFWACWRASLRANRELLWYVPAAIYRGGPTEESVANYTVNSTMAIDGFVELEATIRLLEKLIGRAAEDAGITESFKDSEVVTSPERIHSIEAAIKAFRPEWEAYRAEISFRRPRPRSAIKSALSRGMVDNSYRARRGF